MPDTSNQIHLREVANSSSLLHVEQLRNGKYRRLLNLRDKQTLDSLAPHSSSLAVRTRRERCRILLKLEIEVMEDAVDSVNEAIEISGYPNRVRADLRASLTSCICSLQWARIDGLDAGPPSEESRLDLERHFAIMEKEISDDRTRLADL